MKIEETVVETFSTGTLKTSTASIRASAKAFEILSSSLYSDAITAIVREICANAVDSHKAAKKDKKPFKIQSPNGFDPQFKVRDFGTGMTDEFVMNRLNTYFESTKTDNDDEIGGFGLGIKSVFSYATSFIISCFTGKVRRVYSYQIGRAGMPEISLLAQTPSKEPKGVEISIPVKSQDYMAFQNAIIRNLLFYKTYPEIVGFSPVDATQLTKLAGDNRWSIYKVNNEILKSGTYVEMGGVVYPVSSIEAVNDKVSNQTRNIVIYHVNIGDVDVTPSREAMKATDKTIAAIKNIADHSVSNAEQLIVDYATSNKLSAWQLAAEMDRYSEKSTWINRMMEIAGLKEIEFGGLFVGEGQVTAKSKSIVGSSAMDPHFIFDVLSRSTYHKRHEMYLDRYTSGPMPILTMGYDHPYPIMGKKKNKFIDGYFDERPHMFASPMRHPNEIYFRVEGRERESITYIIAAEGVKLTSKGLIQTMANVRLNFNRPPMVMVIWTVDPQALYDDLTARVPEAQLVLWADDSTQAPTTKFEDIKIKSIQFNTADGLFNDRKTITLGDLDHSKVICYFDERPAYSYRFDDWGQSADISKKLGNDIFAAEFSKMGFDQIAILNENAKCHLAAKGYTLVSFDEAKQPALIKMAGMIATAISGNADDLFGDKLGKLVRSNLSADGAIKALKSWAHVLGVKKYIAEFEDGRWGMTPAQQEIRNFLYSNGCDVKEFVTKHYPNARSANTSPFVIDLLKKAPMAVYSTWAYEDVEVIAYIKECFSKKA